MVSIPERLARLEADQESLRETVERNHRETVDWRTKSTATLEKIEQRLEGFDGLLNQAKGVRWLAGLILTGLGALVIVGIKEVLTWFGRN